MTLNKLSKNNKGSGIAVIIYGVVLMLLLIFTAINILNAKIIESAYNSLRDAVLASSSGSVIHLLTDKTNATDIQKGRIEANQYDIYLQLALGYIINRDTNKTNTSIQGAEINNFIKLDHRKVVNSTMTLLEDAIVRDRTTHTEITDTNKFKIFMFFIEPHYTDNDYEKYFDIIMYTNDEFNYIYDENGNKTVALKDGAGERLLAGGQVGNNTISAGSKGSMDSIYDALEATINNAVNGRLNNNYHGGSFKINLNSSGSSYDKLIREMETMPYYLIVVKDFALPTLFDGVDTNTEDNNIFTMLSGNGSLNSPMCALNSGKTERKLKEN